MRDKLGNVIFQFHKGTIKTLIKFKNYDFYFISIP